MFDKMAFFVYVIRTGSISAAARHFNLSVSAGSRWLQELEQHFDTPLCRRSNRLLTATPAGQTLFDEFSSVVDDAERVTRKLADFQQHERGHINIVATPVYANHFLMSALVDYMNNNPNVTYHLRIDPWALDYANEADLMISANASFQGYREKDLLLVKRELMHCPFVVVASPNYLTKHGNPADPQALKDHQCLFASTLTGSNDWVFKNGSETLLMKVPKTLEVNDSDLLLKLALSGAGVAYLPEFVVREDIKQGRLTTLLDEYETSTWSLNLYYHPAQKASPAAIKFKEFLLTQDCLD